MHQPPQTTNATNRAAVLPLKHTSPGSLRLAGRVAQSMAFFSSGVMEPLYSGQAMMNPWC